MKAAMYGLAIVFVGIFGLILFQLFGNITVTNQQDYTLLKNATEAALYDSIDNDAYKNGFCICTNKDKNSEGKYVFTSKNDYQLKKINNSQGECSSSGFRECKKVIGEVKINSEVFAESFVRRFSENVKGDKNYKIIIQDVIEYPPKVSVEVRSYNNLNDFKATTGTFTDSDFDISNKIDSILEYR